MGKAQPGETRAVFVDELSCIGCKNCIFEVNVFSTEPFL